MPLLIDAARQAMNDLKAACADIIKIDIDGLEALLGDAQSRSMCRIASGSGFSAISVPAGFPVNGLPFGLDFLAQPNHDPKLVSYAFAWEQGDATRVPPAQARRIQ